MSSVLYDEPGPRTRRLIQVGTVAGALVLAGVAAFVLVQFSSRGLLDADRWDIFVERTDVWEFLGRGLLATLQAAATGAVLAGVLAVVLAVLRMSGNGLVRRSTAVVIELFRGLPVVLLMLAGALLLPVSLFWAVVIGLTIYNAAVMGEILRAGILSLPKGQSEAAYAIGLTHFQTLRMILLPQAVRQMLPSLVSQLVVLLKDTSLGYIVGYLELLRSVQNLRDFFGNRYLFSVFFVAAAIYITVNFLVSRLAVLTERVLSRSRSGGGGDVAPVNVDENTPDGGVGTRGGSVPTATSQSRSPGTRERQ
ncbi:amino acid ABC transporter permease [Quadrisphaera sp. GCM10027208]|uniref:amino acid ABC transporter permease n=1 Tax=Quadrisphaera sp. GCM10027208 TaxID=3273423 RepID=UPI0036214CB6